MKVKRNVAKRTVAAVLSAVLSMQPVFVMDGIRVRAEEQTEEASQGAWLFGDEAQAWATDLVYIPAQDQGNTTDQTGGLYVTGGKGFYTSADGITWTECGNDADAQALKETTYGFAYGGKEGSKGFLILPDTTAENKVYLADESLTALQTAKTVTSAGEDLRLKGEIEWDDYSGLFYCGAVLSDGTKAGLYYSDASYTTDEESREHTMVWTKADSGENALIAEDTVWPAQKMTAVIGSITSDGAGHLVAAGIWANKLNGDFYSTCQSALGIPTCQTVLLLTADNTAADGSVVTARLSNFSGYNTGNNGAGLSTAVIDQKSNVMIQDTSSYKVLNFISGSFANLWALGSETKVSKAVMKNNIKYAVNPNSGASSNCIHTNNMTNALSKIVCLEDKILLIPRSGQGVGGNNYLSDLFVVTYNEDGTLKNRFLPFINNKDTAKAVMGDYVNDKDNRYLAGAAAGENGQVMLITGRNTKEIAEAKAYPTTVTVLETADTITDSTVSAAEIAMKDRTDKLICITNSAIYEPPAVPDPEEEEIPGHAVDSLNVTGKMSKADEEWLKKSQSDTLVKAMLNGNVAFVAGSKRVWTGSAVEEFERESVYLEEEQSFLLPVSAVNKAFELNVQGQDGMISQEEVQKLTGKYVFLDPRGFLLFSTGKVVKDELPTVAGWTAYEDFFVVADAMGYITWKDQTITEEQRLSYLKKWRGALSIPEGSQVSDTYRNAAIQTGLKELETVTYTIQDGKYTVSKIDTILDKNKIVSDLKTYKTELFNSYKSLQTMAIGYHCMPDKTTEDAVKLKNIILAGLEYLLDFYSEQWTYKADGTSNWTLTQFSLPITVSNTLCLVYDELNATEEGKKLLAKTCNQIFDKSPIPNLRSGESIKNCETYTNRLWRCYSYFNAAMVAGDTYRMNYALKYSTAAYSYSPANSGFDNLVFNRDGFYEDGSMIFHSGIPYNMGYGVSYSVLIYEMMELTKDTVFDIRTLYGFDNVYDFCLNNMLPFLNNGLMMKMTVGRGNVLADTAMLRNIAYIANNALDEEKKEELTRGVKEVLNGRSFTPGSLQYLINGAKLGEMYQSFEDYAQTLDVPAQTAEESTSTVYYNQDQVIHKTNRFLAALSMSSQRIKKYESYKTTNATGWYLGDGMLYVYTDDLQYTDSWFENADPYFMPGTTVDSTERVPIHTETETNWGNPENTWAGGATDGRNTVAGYQLGNQYVSGLEGNKSYFFFGDKIICLGSGITGGEGEAYTVLENRALSKKNGEEENSALLEVKELTVSEEGSQSTIHQVMDGNLSTNCSLKYIGDEIVFDFGEKVSVGYVAMAFTYGNQRYEKAKIQVSDDGNTWSEVTDFASDGSGKGMVLYSIPCSGRYFKIINQGYEYKSGTVGTRFALAEIEFYDGAYSKEEVEAYRSTIHSGFEELIVDGNATALQFNEQQTLTTPGYLWLEDQEGFVMLETSDVKMMREGNPGAPVTMRLWVSHGENPANAGYAYLQLPKATLEETKAFAEEPGITILENSTKAHIIQDQTTGLIGANLFESEVTVEGITFHTPCSVLLDKAGGRLYVTDPTQTSSEISFTIPQTMENLQGSGLSVNGKDVVLRVNAKRGSTHALTFENALQNTVSLAGDENRIAVGETIDVSVEVKEKFASCEIVLEYDSEKLKLEKLEPLSGEASLKTVGYEDVNGTLKLADYGETKQGGYRLAFRTVVDGEAKVTLKSASFSTQEKAKEEDLMPAIFGNCVVTVPIAKARYQVTLSNIFTGAGTVLDGDEYRFYPTDALHYDYAAANVQMSETQMTVTANADGSYTIPKVTSDPVITGSRTPKSYAVAYTTDSGVKNLPENGTAVYGQDYVFTLPMQEHYTITVTGIFRGGEEIPYAVGEDGKVTIEGVYITGDLTIKIDRTVKDHSVRAEGTGASDVVYEKEFTPGEDYQFTLNADEAYDYTVTVKVNDREVETQNEGAVYTIPAAQVKAGEIVILVEKVLKEGEITVTEYVKLDGTVMWLVNKKLPKFVGRRFTYRENAMYWSDSYQAYCTLVIAPERPEVTTQDFELLAEESPSVDYGMDVNMSGKLDANDAQLVYNMYNARYADYTQEVSMEKFLRADVNGSGCLTVEDAAAIIGKCLEKR